MNTHLLKGKVVHRRARPARHELEHDVWYFALDLDELGELHRRVPLIAHNGRGIVSFHDSDYLPGRAHDLSMDIRAHLARHQIEIGEGRITLVTNLRIIGYQFNPASFYLCRDEAGSLATVVIEVHNTYGERHLYTLRSAPDGATTLRGEMDKGFFVSPFISADGRYHVTVRDAADRLAVGINLRQDGRPVLATSLELRRLPLTTATLLRLLLRYPLTPQRTTALIHWHAFRLWLKHVPWHRHVVDDGESATARIAAHGASR